MNAIMKMVDSPALALMRGAVENRRMAEELAASRAANEVLTAELESARQALKEALRRERVLRLERNDARHERDELRARRDRAYAYAVATNRKAKRRGEKRDKIIMAAITAAWAIPAMVVLCGKAWAWAMWIMGY